MVKGFRPVAFYLTVATYIIALVTFAGAPEAPDPASIYDGEQIILIKTDNTSFPTGDLWKCVTCGVPSDNAVGQNDTFDYPNAFQDGKCLLNVTPGGSGAGGSIRELRLHPYDVHLGFDSLSIVDGSVLQYAYFSRLQFDPSPTTGEPLAPRYDLVNVTMLYSPDNTP
ncbi:hypothetical protein M426DRAFT_20200 [Hypoxylon sp. CI-4A]|nr:hypothetical protein M426DRAFT_20200 [Hypoxylon sp. CI-4A]